TVCSWGDAAHGPAQLCFWEEPPVWAGLGASWAHGVQPGAGRERQFVMSVLVLLIVASLAMAGFFLAAFIWAVRSGQYEDTCTPSMRLLLDDKNTKTEPRKNSLSNQNSNEP